MAIKLTSFLLLLKLVLLFAVLFVIIRDVGVWGLVMMAIVRWRRLPCAIQAGELCGTDLLRARGAGHAPLVLSPALLSRAAAGGQEALSHGCSSRVAPPTCSSPHHHNCSKQNAWCDEKQSLCFIWTCFDHRHTHTHTDVKCMFFLFSLAKE